MLLPDAGLLYVGAVLFVAVLLEDVLLLLTDELDLPVLFPTLIPPLMVPLVALTELDALLDELWLEVNDPEDSVRARRP